MYHIVVKTYRYTLLVSYSPYLCFPDPGMGFACLYSILAHNNPIIEYYNTLQLQYNTIKYSDSMLDSN